MGRNEKCYLIVIIIVLVMGSIHSNGALLIDVVDGDKISMLTTEEKNGWMDYGANAI